MTTILFAGQGAQFTGMGKDLFADFPKELSSASELLGYSIEELCLKNTDNRLSNTTFAQPALYIVNALSWLKKKNHYSAPIKFFMGHSLGEYNALLAAGGFDFLTGLKLVKKRGELMGQAKNGGMIAVMGSNVERINEILTREELFDIDLVNFNTPTQTILSGPKESLVQLETCFEKESIMVFPLNVSAAFHSRYMHDAQKEFANFIADFQFKPLETPVIANVNAKPYEDTAIARRLAEQIASPVLWEKSVRYVLQQDESDFQEIMLSERAILSNMVQEIKKTMN